MAPKKPKQRKPKRELTPRQKKLVTLLPDVQAGRKTKKEALLEAGYSENTANQQSGPLGSVRNNTLMQAALRNAGVTEEFLARQIKDGTGAWHKGMFGTNPDFHARAQFVKLGAELLDAFPSKKIDVTDVTPLTYADVEGKKAKTLDEARRMAEELDDGDED